MSDPDLLRLFDRVVDGTGSVERFRAVVLDLATRGCLTERDESEESAAELLNTIDAALGNQSRTRQAKRSATLLPVDAEAPFDLPHNWVWTRVRRITRDRGQVVPTTAFTYIDVSSIDKERGRIRDPQALDPENAPSRARKVVKRGDVVYSCVRPYLLNTAVLDTDLDPDPIASTAFAVLDGGEFINPYYMWAVLRSPYMIRCVEEKMRGQAYPAINDRDFALLPFPLAPHNEQDRIVDAINELMALCDQVDELQRRRDTTRDRLRAAALERLTAPTETPGKVPQKDVAFVLSHSDRMITKPEHVAALRRTIPRLAVQGRLVAQDATDEPASLSLRKIATKHGRTFSDVDGPYTLPTGWTWATFADYGKLGRGKSKHRPRNDPVLYSGGTIPFIQTGDVARSRGRITSWTVHYNDVGLSQSALWPAGTLCITIAANIADSGILSFDACFPDSVVGLVVDPEFDDARYVEYFLRTAKEDLSAFAPSTAQKNINLGILNEVRIPTPPVEEQRRIVVKVDELMTLCDELEQALRATEEGRAKLLDAVLHEALNRPVVGTQLAEATA